MLNCKRPTAFGLAFGLLLSGSALAQADLRAGETYSQDFDSLANSGTTNTALPPGWALREQGSNANGQYRAADGAGNAGDTLSLGASGDSERAFGTLLSGSLASTLGVQLRNAGSSTITELQISYTGEQWRQGAINRCDRLDAALSTNATALTDGDWTEVDALDFTAPKCETTTGGLNGNLAENQVAVSHTLQGLSLAPGASLWMRWVDFNASGADDSLALDNVQIVAVGSGPALPQISVGPASIEVSEGAVATTTPIDFVLDVQPAPAEGSPVSFDIEVLGEAGRFSYSGPSQLQIDHTTTLPLTVTALAVGNDLVQGNSSVTLRLSNFSGAAANQADPLEKVATIVEDDLPSLPTVAFAAGELSVAEGGNDDANRLDFVLDIQPAPEAGSPLRFNVAVSGPSGRFSYAGPASVEITDATPLPYTVSVGVLGNEEDEADASVTVSLSGFVGADASQASPIEKSGQILDDDLPVNEIAQIQGPGACSPFVTVCDSGQPVTGSTVRTRGNIVTAIGASGFTMQTPTAREDNSSLTSDGIYVFTGGAPRTDDDELLAIGDSVEVIGSAAEFYGLTQIAVAGSRNANNRIRREASNQPMPRTVHFGPIPTSPGSTLPGSGFDIEFQTFPSRNPNQVSCGALGNFECFEGMRVSIPGGAVTVANQRRDSKRYAEVWISPYGERGLREKGVRFGTSPLPSTAGAAGVWDGNPEILEMDADFMLPALTNAELAGGTRFSAVGVIGFDFGDYEFWPTALDIVDGSNTVVRPVPAAASDELTLGSFNAFRLCDEFANTTSRCSANDAMELDAARVAHEIGQISAYLREVLGSPDVIGLQEVENVDVLQRLAAKIAEDGGPTYSAHLIEGNDVGGIDVGYLVNTARITDVVVEQRLGAETWADPGSSTGPRLLHDRPPLLLQASFIGNGRPFAFQVINNHTRSRTGVDVSNADGERNRAKRFLQAASIATLVQALQTDAATADIPLFVIGDHNAFEFTDGYVDVVGLVAGTYINDENTCAPANGITACQLDGGANIVQPALINAVDLLDRSERYSYKFTENFGAIQGSDGRDLASNQVLDHGLFNAVAAPFVTGMAYGRANVDASAERFRSCRYFVSRFSGDATRDYNAERCGVALPAFSPVGSSDHDGFVLFVSPPKPDEIFANGFE